MKPVGVNSPFPSSYDFEEKPAAADSKEAELGTEKTEFGQYDVVCTANENPYSV